MHPPCFLARHNEVYEFAKKLDFRFHVFLFRHTHQSCRCRCRSRCLLESVRVCVLLCACVCGVCVRVIPNEFVARVLRELLGKYCYPAADKELFPLSKLGQSKIESRGAKPSLCCMWQAADAKRA